MEEAGEFVGKESRSENDASVTDQKERTQGIASARSALACFPGHVGDGLTAARLGINTRGAGQLSSPPSTMMSLRQKAPIPACGPSHRHDHEALPRMNKRVRTIRRGSSAPHLCPR